MTIHIYKLSVSSIFYVQINLLNLGSGGGLAPLQNFRGGLEPRSPPVLYADDLDASGGPAGQERKNDRRTESLRNVTLLRLPITA